MFAKLFAIAGLLAIASALPSSERSTGTLTERANVPCKPGTLYYRCFQYNGCFAKDPCDPNKPPPSSAVKTLQSYTITRPRSYNIHPLSNTKEEDKVPHVDLEKPRNSRTVTTNVVVFDNVPKGAQNCQLMWRSAITDGDNRLDVVGKGEAWTRQLNGFPIKTQAVSFFSIKKYQNTNAQWSRTLDFTGWGNTTSDSHGGPALKCAEQVAVETKGNDEGEQENRVFMTLTDKNGFYLRYDL